MRCGHGRRIYAEEQAKLVAAVWGTEFIKFLVALAIFYQDDVKDIMKWFKIYKTFEGKKFLLKSAM